MHAVVKIKGKQFLVQAGSRIRVASFNNEPGTQVDLDAVMLTAEGKAMHFGDNKHIIKAKVVRHGLSDKILVLKHHARKRYRRKQGHRQPYTELMIETIEPLKA